jgi:hypothetical protein
MTITPSSLLSLPIVTTGTESGVWGDVVNNGLTAYLDIAVAGELPLTITTTDVTLVKTAGTSSATAIGSTTAQYAILNISGAKTAARNLNLPATSKWYIIHNAGTGGFLLTVRGVTPTTGVTLVDGEECIVAWNGSDFVKVSSTLLTALTGTLSVANGGTGATTLTANNVLLGNGTSAPSFVAPSTNGNVLTSNGTTWVSTAPAASGVTSAVAGNGVAVSAATGAVTFSLSAPTFNTVGSYAVGSSGAGPVAFVVGTSYSAAATVIPGASGTWRCVGVWGSIIYGCSVTYTSTGLFVRTV